MSNSTKKYYQIASLEKGMRVLELLAEKESLSVSAVAKQLDYNRATCHRFLATFRDLGYVEKNQSGEYHLTLRILEMGYKVANRFEIQKIAQPYMQELSVEFKETINLGVQEGLYIFHIDKINSPEALRMDASIGSHAPLYCTALGKSILANRSSEEVEDYLEKASMEACGPNSITSKEQLRQELADIRHKGYAIDDEEYTAGLRCIGVPIFDHTRTAAYAISVSGPTMRMTIQVIDKAREMLLEIGKRLSAEIGYNANGI